MYVKEISVNQGPTLQRYKPRAFGRASKIRKRTSHITITLGIREESGIDIEKAKKKVIAPEKPANLEDVQKEIEKEAKKQKQKQRRNLKRKQPENRKRNQQKNP